MEAKITVLGGQDLIDLFASEDHVLSNDRASYTMNIVDKHVEFIVQAKDAVALRAILSGITKTLAIHEKVGGLVQNDK